jgi:hypothetical protein
MTAPGQVEERLRHGESRARRRGQGRGLAEQALRGPDLPGDPVGGTSASASARAASRQPSRSSSAESWTSCTQAANSSICSVLGLSRWARSARSVSIVGRHPSATRNGRTLATETVSRAMSSRLSLRQRRDRMIRSTALTPSRVRGAAPRAAPGSRRRGSAPMLERPGELGIDVERQHAVGSGASTTSAGLKP